jgi:MFS transporter, BCD family, chlorophyll transporter
MTAPLAPAALGWLGIVRLGLVQMSLGAIVVLTTSTMNRVMVVELALPAILPGALVAWHYGVQILRPLLGHGSDVGGRRTSWIIGGMAVLTIGGVAAAAATALMGSHLGTGIVLAIVAFTLIGGGVGASGTSLLALLAKRVDPRRRAAAATIVWLMMIAGIVVTAGIAGQLLDPFSPARLVAVTAAVASVGFLLTLIAVWNVEGAVRPTDGQSMMPHAAPSVPFRDTLGEVWAEPAARRLTIFIFLSMLAYSAQELILEPFAGAVFGLTPGGSTKVTGVQHGGVLVGMLLVALAGTVIGGPRLGSMRTWTVGGCVVSALMLAGLAAAGFVGPAWPLRSSVFALGIANGAFSIAAIGSMMGLASGGREAREGVRMGLWGAAQALAFAAGGIVGTAASDLARYLFGSPVTAYSAVFLGEAVLFLVAARQASHVFQPAAKRSRPPNVGIAAAPATAGED